MKALLNKQKAVHNLCDHEKDLKSPNNDACQKENSQLTYSN